MNLPKISGDEALSMILKDLPLEGVHVTGEIKLPYDKANNNDDIYQRIIISNSRIENLESAFKSFYFPVEINNSVIEKCDFYATSFFAGLKLANSIFEHTILFQSGGHNKNNALVQIENCTFEGFVDFADCWYEGVVVIRGNKFLQGTNLLNKESHNTSVQFDVKPLIENNEGAIDLNIDLVGHHQKREEFEQMLK